MPNTQPPSHKHALFSLTEDELEDVVEDEVRASLGAKLEGLSVVHRTLLLINLRNDHVSLLLYCSSKNEPMATYEKLASDKNDNATLDGGGLGIEGRDLVLDLAEGEAL